MTGLVLALALAAGAVVAGVMFGAAISSEPLLATMNPGDYVRAKQFAGPRLDPLMPALTCLSGLLEVVAAALVEASSARAALVVAAVATASVVVVSARGNVPINRWVALLDPAELPVPGRAWAADPRARWRRWHLVRTALAVVAVLADALAVSLLVH